MKDKFAFVTFIICNDTYIPGALVSAYSLTKQSIQASLVCLITNSVSPEGEKALSLLYDRVIRVPEIKTGAKGNQRQQYLPYVCTRLHALRLGPGGDLGCRFEKVVLFDADILPLRHYQQLFLVPGPAAILNEAREHFKEWGDDDSLRHGVWPWHRRYSSYPHGTPVPKGVTDRVIFDRENLGMNTGLMARHAVSHDPLVREVA